MDILDITCGVIAQQVNLQGKMGAGLALQIRNRYPVVYTTYLRALPDLALGQTLIVPVARNLYVANLVGQERYGRTGQHTNYMALTKALYALDEFHRSVGLPVYIPQGMGAGLGGGDWNLIRATIHHVLPYAVIIRRDDAAEAPL